MGLRRRQGETDLLSTLFKQQQAGQNAPQPNSLFDQLRRGGIDDTSNKVNTQQKEDLSISRGAFFGAGSSRGVFLS